MKTLLILSVAACALAGAADNDNQLRMADTTANAYTYALGGNVNKQGQPFKIWINTEKGQVIIDCSTGEVTTTGTVTLTEGAAEFYKAVALQGKQANPGR